MHLPSNLAQNQRESLQLVLVFFEENSSAEGSELLWVLERCIQDLQSTSRGKGRRFHWWWRELNEQIWDTVEFIKSSFPAAKTLQVVAAHVDVPPPSLSQPRTKGKLYFLSYRLWC